MDLEDKVNKTLEKYLDRVNEKLDDKTVDTSMVHEDIRIIHHIVKIRDEMKIANLSHPTASDQ